MRWYLLLFPWVLAGAAEAGPLTEADVIRMGLEQASYREMVERRAAAADEEASSRGRWSNPEIEFSRESVDLPTGGSSTDRFYWLRQELELAGIPALERRAAEATAVAERARLELQRREWKAELRGLFYDALAAGRKAKLVSRWKDEVEALLEDVRRRVAAGDAARFDQLRLEHELASIRAQRLEARAGAHSARTRLFRLLDREPQALAGAVLPAGSASGIIEDHPLLSALDAQAESAVERARARRRERWPELTVGVGRRETREAGIDADGPVVALELEVPLFQRGDRRAAAASAEADALRAERELAAMRLRGELEGLEALLKARRQAAEALEPDGSETQSELTHIADAAYAGGEMTVMELIDAHRAEFERREQALANALSARRVWIAIQQLTGDLQ